jgi:hypothetical protein
MDWAAQQHSIKEMSDWYKITYKDLQTLGGSSLLEKFESLSQLISDTYPEYEWLPWKHEQCPKNYWNELKHQRKFLEWAKKQLNVKEMNDWLKVSNQVSMETKYSNVTRNYQQLVAPRYCKSTIPL